MRNNLFRIEKISPFGDSLYIKFIGKRKLRPAFSKGEKMVNFSFNDILSTKKVQIQDLIETKKYLLIDFWGSWCKPCIESFPDLKKQFDSLKNRNVDFVGVVYDNLNAYDKVIEILNEHEIVWNQFFVDRNSTNTIISKLKVSVFPSYILINSKAKIVYRGEGKKGFQDAMKILKRENIP